MITKTMQEEIERLKEVYQKYRDRDIDSKFLAKALTVIRILVDDRSEKYESLNVLYERLEARDDYVIKHLEEGSQLIGQCCHEGATYVGLALKEIKNA